MCVGGYGALGDYGQRALPYEVSGGGGGRRRRGGKVVVVVVGWINL